MKDWDYARLTHDASQAGGVEAYIEMIRQAGFADGKRSMLPWITAAVGAGCLLKLTIDKAVDAYRSRKKEEENLKKNEEMAKSRLKEMCVSRPDCEGTEEAHD